MVQRHTIRMTLTPGTGHGMKTVKRCQLLLVNDGKVSGTYDHFVLDNLQDIGCELQKRDSVENSADAQSSIIETHWERMDAYRKIDVRFAAEF